MQQVRVVLKAHRVSLEPLEIRGLRVILDSKDNPALLVPLALPGNLDLQGLLVKLAPLGHRETLAGKANQGRPDRQVQWDRLDLRAIKELPGRKEHQETLDFKEFQVLCLRELIYIDIARQWDTSQIMFVLLNSVILTRNTTSGAHIGPTDILNYDRSKF